MILLNLVIVKSVVYTIMCLKGRTMNSNTKIKMLNLAEKVSLLEGEILFLEKG